MILIRGSNTGVFISGNFQTLYQEACPRITVLRGRGNVEPIEKQPKEENPVFAVGYEFERYFKAVELAGCEFQDEFAVEFEIIPGKVMFQGHCDVSIGDEILELKSCTSKNTYRDVFHKGKPKLSNLFQLIAYMIGTNKTKGRLIYGSYYPSLDYKDLKNMTVNEALEKATHIIPEFKTFYVTIDSKSEDGVISINGKESEFSIVDVNNFWLEIAKYHESETTPPTPIGYGGKGNPCFFCPFKPVCSTTNAGSISDFENTLLTEGLATATNKTPG